MTVGLDCNCKVILISDNYSVIFIVYFPPNCRSLIQPLDNGILRLLKLRYRTHLMRCLLRVVNSGKPVCEFIHEFIMRDIVYCAANAWKLVDTARLTYGWHKLWLGLIFKTSPGKDHEPNFTGFRLSKENK